MTNLKPLTSPRLNRDVSFHELSLPSALNRNLFVPSSLRKNKSLQLSPLKSSEMTNLKSLTSVVS